MSQAPSSNLVALAMSLGLYNRMPVKHISQARHSCIVVQSLLMPVYLAMCRYTGRNLPVPVICHGTSHGGFLLRAVYARGPAALDKCGGQPWPARRRRLGWPRALWYASARRRLASQ